MRKQNRSVRSWHFSALALLVVAALTLSACGGSTSSDTSDTAQPQTDNAQTSADTGAVAAPSDGEVTTIRWGTITAPDHPLTKMAEWFAERLAENSNGRLQAEIFPAGQLGDDLELQEAVVAGAVEMGSVGNTLQVFPESGIFWLPFLFPDGETAREIIGGDLGKEVYDTFLDKGVRVLYVEDHGFRQVSSSKPINSIADFDGLKIRVPEAPLFLSTFEALGANPTPVDFTELYSALEQGVVDAQENACVATLAPRFFEVQSNLALTNHMYTPNPVIVNEAFFSGLDPELQEAMLKTAEEAKEYQYGIADQEDRDACDQLAAEGMEITEPPYEELRAAVEPVYAEIGAEYDQDLLARIQAAAQS